MRWRIITPKPLPFFGQAIKECVKNQFAHPKIINKVRTKEKKREKQHLFSRFCDNFLFLCGVV